MYKKLILLFMVLISIEVLAENNRIIIASTTSTYDSGLLKYINKKFEDKYNYKVHVIALGTGQALRMAKNGDADLLLVHHTPSEIEFVNSGYGLKRYKLMYNNYILVGPKEFKNKCSSIKEILSMIKKDKFTFVSRSDESGTHKKEKELWKLINAKPQNFSDWYLKIGQGMGSALMMSNELQAFTLADKATWLSFNNKINLKIICEYKNELINQYGIILVNPKINPKINFDGAKIYINWIISDEGKKLINSFNLNNEQLFFYNYK